MDARRSLLTMDGMVAVVKLGNVFPDLSAIYKFELPPDKTVELPYCLATTPEESPPWRGPGSDESIVVRFEFVTRSGLGDARQWVAKAVEFFDRWQFGECDGDKEDSYFEGRPTVELVTELADGTFKGIVDFEFVPITAAAAAGA